jgi:hypothetical protein
MFAHVLYWAKCRWPIQAVTTNVLTYLHKMITVIGKLLIIKTVRDKIT